LQDDEGKSPLRLLASNIVGKECQKHPKLHERETTSLTHRSRIGQSFYKATAENKDQPSKHGRTSILKNGRIAST
jgi:hypothetical protein